MKTTDILSSLFLILIGALFCFSSLNIGIGKINAPGPGLIPFGTGALLILFSTGTIVEMLVTKRPEGRVSASSGGRWWLVFGVLLSLFVYALVLNSIGFIPATFIILALLFKVSEQQSWKISLGAAALTTACTYLLFGYALGCSLPPGVFGFLGL